MGLPERRSATVPAARRTGGPPAINPNLILGVRFILTSLVCALALATAIMAILVVDVSVQGPQAVADASREAATARR
jgi:hypothetical protein